MRILLISHTCQSQKQGQPKALELCRIPGVELRVIVPDRWYEYGKWRGAEEQLDKSFGYKIEKVLLPWAGPAQWYLHCYPGLAKQLQEFQPDIIDIWEEPWGLVSAQTVWLRNRLLPGAKLISETEQNTYRKLPPPFELFRSYTLRNADYLIGRSHEAVENMRLRGYSGPAGVVPNAVDADLFHPMDREACRNALGLSGFVAGYIGRLVEEKGLIDMVDALPRCPEDVNLLFVGKGAYQAVLEKRIQQIGLKHRVRFLPYLPMEDLPRVMNAIDTLVLPSWTMPTWREQFGRVIIEAHACETPVIGSNSGAIPFVLGNGGLVFPERDACALAAAFQELYENPERAREMGHIGYQQAHEKYTWQRVAEQMVNIYRQILEADTVEAEKTAKNFMLA